MSSVEKAIAEIKIAVKDSVKEINYKSIGKATRGLHIIRNEELMVLRGKRGGRTYKKPFSKSKYAASAPGEPPAVRTGHLRQHWTQQAKITPSFGNGITIMHIVEPVEKYAVYLENGTRKMAPRPFIDKITEQALPKLQKLYTEV